MSDGKYAKQDVKICPSCNNKFECKSRLIQQCECATIHLTQMQREQIKENFRDCLCVDCLQKISHGGRIV